MGKKDGKSQKNRCSGSAVGRGGAEIGPMGLMGCDKRVWAMRGRQRREQRRGGEAVLFPGVL